MASPGGDGRGFVPVGDGGTAEFLNINGPWRGLLGGCGIRNDLAVPLHRRGSDL